MQQANCCYNRQTPQNHSQPVSTYLVQSFVGETQVLGVTTIVDKDDEDEKMAQSDDQDDDEVEGTLEEVFLPGLESAASTLYIGNVEPGNCLVQVTETEVRLRSVFLTPGPISVVAQSP